MSGHFKPCLLWWSTRYFKPKHNLFLTPTCHNVKLHLIIWNKWRVPTYLYDAKQTHLTYLWFTTLYSGDISSGDWLQNKSVSSSVAHNCTQKHYHSLFSQVKSVSFLCILIVQIRSPPQGAVWCEYVQILYLAVSEAAYGDTVIPEPRRAPITLSFCSAPWTEPDWGRSRSTATGMSCSLYTAAQTDFQIQQEPTICHLYSSQQQGEPYFLQQQLGGRPRCSSVQEGYAKLGLRGHTGIMTVFQGLQG